MEQQEEKSIKKGRSFVKILVYFVVLLAIVSVASVIYLLRFSPEASIDDVLAVVGDKEITQRDVNELIYGISFEGSIEEPIDVDESQEEEFLNQLIEWALVEMKAGEMGISVSEEDFEREAENRFGENGMDYINSLTGDSRVVTEKVISNSALINKLKQSLVPWAEGTAIIIRFDRYLSYSDMLEHHRSIPLEDAEILLEEHKNYATNLKDEIYDLLIKEEITVEDAVEKVNTDPVIGVNTFIPDVYPLFSFDFEKEDLVVGAHLDTLPLSYHILESQVGVNNPILMNTESVIVGNDPHPGFWAIIYIEEKNQYDVDSYENWLEEARENYVQLKVSLPFFFQFKKLIYAHGGVDHTCNDTDHWGVKGGNIQRPAGLIVKAQYINASGNTVPLDGIPVTIRGTGEPFGEFPNLRGPSRITYHNPSYMNEWVYLMEENTPREQTFTTGSVWYRTGTSWHPPNRNNAERIQCFTPGYLVLGMGYSAHSGDNQYQSMGNMWVLSCRVNPYQFTIPNTNPLGTGSGSWEVTTSGAWSLVALGATPSPAARPTLLNIPGRVGVQGNVANGHTSEITFTWRMDAVLPPQAECGSSHGQTRTTPPTHGLCAFGGGTPSTVTTGTNRYTWTCSLPGSQVSCFAHREQVPVNGACGSAHGSTVLAPPTSGLCTRGNPTSITTTTRNYTWRCLGTDGGSNASCSANRLLEEAKRVPYPSGGRLYSFVAAVNPSVGSPRRLDPYAGSSRIIPWNSPSMPSSCERQTTLTLERSTHSRNYGQQARLKYRYKLDDHPWSPFIYAPSPYTPGVSHVNVILREGQDYDIEAHSYSDNRCDGETYGGSIAGRFQVNHKPRVISIEPIAPPQANNWPWGVNPNNGVSGNQNRDARNFVINSDDAIPFAKGPGLEEECRTPSGRLYGDANGDGSITTADVQLVIQASLGIVTLDSVSREAADVNGDGDISILDVVLIERYVNGLIDAFPVCPSLPPAPVDGDLDGGCVIDNPKYFRVVFEDLDGCDDIDPRNTDIPDDVYEGFATTRQLGLRAVDRNSPSYVVNGSLQSQEIQCLPGGNRLSAVFRIEFTGNQNRNFNLQASARDVLGNRSYYSSPHSAYAHSHGNPAYWLQPTAADVWSYDGRGPRLEIEIKILGPQELRVEWSAIDNLNSLSGLRFLRTYASLVRGTVLDQDDDYSGIYYNTESADPTYLPVSEDFGYYYEIIADRLALNPSDAEAQRTITRTAQRDVDIGINQDGDLVFSMVGVDRACNYIYEEEGLELGAPWIATRGGFVYSRGGINLPSRDNIRYSSLMGGALGLGDESATLSTEWVAPFGNITYGYSSNPYNNEIGVPIYEVLREIAERRFPDGAGRWSDETIDLSRCVDEPFVYFIEGDLNINPDDYRNLAQADGAGCIFVVDGNMTIGPGEYRSTFNSLNDFQVGYDVMRGLFIVEGEINIEFGDADKEVRDGLKVVGGLMAFETENTDTAIRLRRSLQLRDNLTHPTLMLFHDPRYIEIAREIFGDTLGGGHIRDVGFLE